MGCRGPFLDGDDYAWRLPAADRLRRQLLRHLSAIGAYWERAGQWERAIDCSLKALEADEGAEEAARRLMRVYLRLGRRSEAHQIYQRCRGALASLRLEPSRETESLYRQLRSG